jgi:hypothetical protein
MHYVIPVLFYNHESRNHVYKKSLFKLRRIVNINANQGHIMLSVKLFSEWLKFATGLVAVGDEIENSYSP